MTWNTNYGRFSKSYYGYLWDGQTYFLDDPDSISQSGLRAFSSAFWLYMTPREHLPSPHDVVTRKWAPNESDALTGAT